MNTNLSIALVVALLFFNPGKNEKIVNVNRVVPGDISISQELKTLKMDVQHSKVLWKGTKMRGLGSHEGSIRLKRAYLLERNNVIVGGKFTADMHSIDVTDIPKSDPVPYNNLKRHLKSEHFFDVTTYPEGEFVISKVDKLFNGLLKIQGNITLKQITHNIEFTAIKKNKVLSAVLLIDRFKWNIEYKGSWLEKTLVDKDIELKMELVMK